MVNATAVLEKREHRGRITPERVIVLRVTARPTPLVIEASPDLSVGGCLECGCMCGRTGCRCGCECCPYPHPLPCVVGTVVGTGAEA